MSGCWSVLFFRHALGNGAVKRQSQYGDCGQRFTGVKHNHESKAALIWFGLLALIQNLPVNCRGPFGLA
ncbi:hypothetical protein COO20_00875 [Thalassospira marina]|uniref:Uncharacterized protein n=1 Tax=Thalassospira marina TaxID=2048283 RepID=A0A2N3KZ17_9PROT|nr:hypothetical protein COO20_00875 [Thalassospira marina]